MSNTGLVLHKLGVPVRLIAKVGDDSFGHVVTRIIDAVDPDLLSSMELDPQAITSYTIIISPRTSIGFFCTVRARITNSALRM